MTCQHKHPLPARILNDPESFGVYLMEFTATGLMLEAFHARCNAGLSEEALAHRLGWSIRKVKRYERDFENRMTIREWVSWLVACGVVPQGSELVPIDTVRTECYTVDESWGEDVLENSPPTKFLAGEK